MRNCCWNVDIDMLKIWFIARICTPHMILTSKNVPQTGVCKPKGDGNPLHESHAKDTSMFSRRSSVIIGIPWLIAGLGSVSRGPGMRDRIKAIQRSRQAKHAEARWPMQGWQNGRSSLLDFFRRDVTMWLVTAACFVGCRSDFDVWVAHAELDALVLSPDANRRAIHPPLPPPPPPPQQPPTITTTITATPDGHEAHFRSCLTECQSCWLPVHQSRLSSGGARLRNSPYLPSSSWRVLPPVPRSLTAIASPPTLRRRRRRCRRRSPLPLPHHSPSL
ncbi:hypothetical protein CIHG_00511 [Coccidioides immitis H538.4]|uniref:Uncharacterized protein n=1 Tax=Coccidioides immitis H538.4 TaxID=396776 RepID=A0A0J8RDV3_COCIT|nr:hypothetical protein CIHG_00511 [Coccidioides immitis H538.4]